MGMPAIGRGLAGSRSPSTDPGALLPQKAWGSITVPRSGVKRSDCWTLRQALEPGWVAGRSRRGLGWWLAGLAAGPASSRRETSPGRRPGFCCFWEKAFDHRDRDHARLEINRADHVADRRDEDLRTGAPHQVDIVGSGRQDFGDRTQVVAGLGPDAQTDDLLMIVLAFRQRPGLDTRNLDELIAQAFGGLARRNTLQAEPDRTTLVPSGPDGVGPTANEYPLELFKAPRDVGQRGHLEVAG